MVVELTHLATLYHDDVMDEALVRRGAVSANSRYGNAVAILTGDFLFSRASNLLADLGPHAVRLQAVTFERLVTGQIRETVGPPDGADPIEHYLAVLADKTGSLIATSAEFGALFAGVDAATTDRLRAFGEQIGVAFQLSDDLLDIASDSAESGKTPGTDLREGVATLPALYALRSSDEPSRRLRELVGRPLPDDDEHAEALRLLRAVHRAGRGARDAPRPTPTALARCWSTCPTCPPGRRSRRCATSWSSGPAEAHRASIRLRLRLSRPLCTSAAGGPPMTTYRSEPISATGAADATAPSTLFSGRRERPAPLVAKRCAWGLAVFMVVLPLQWYSPASGPLGNVRYFHIAAVFMLLIARPTKASLRAAARRATPVFPAAAMVVVLGTCTSIGWHSGTTQYIQAGYYVFFGLIAAGCLIIALTDNAAQRILAYAAPATVIVFLIALTISAHNAGVNICRAVSQAIGGNPSVLEFGVFSAGLRDRRRGRPVEPAPRDLRCARGHVLHGCGREQPQRVCPQDDLRNDGGHRRAGRVVAVPIGDPRRCAHRRSSACYA